jgi:hypothetical protein
MYEVFKQFDILVCGYEVLTATSPTLYYKYLGNSGTQTPLKVSTIISTSESNCPIVGYAIIEKFNGADRVYSSNQVTIDSSGWLTFDTSSPITATLYIQAYSKAPKFV